MQFIEKFLIYRENYFNALEIENGRLGPGSGKCCS